MFKIVHSFASKIHCLFHANKMSKRLTPKKMLPKYSKI